MGSGTHLRRRSDVSAPGAKCATDAVDALRVAIDRLHDKSVAIRTTETTTVNRVGGASRLNRYGGIMAGGQQIAGGEAFAFARGGILDRPTFFGNVLAGEAGPEAIVPLIGSLANVDASVRDLAVYARGMSGYGGGTTNIKSVSAPVTITNYATDPKQLASAVIDRMSRAIS